MFTVASLVVLLLPTTSVDITAASGAVRPPDVIVLLTDDQRHDTMRYLPGVVRHLPVRYVNAFVSNPVCCPSRATDLSGLLSHDNGVWTNEPTFGAWRAFKRWQDAGGISIAQALQSAGYRTGLFGKFLNAWDGSWSPPGWDLFYGMEHNPSNGPRAPYYDYTLGGWNESGPFEEAHGGDATDYSTDVLASHAIDFITSTSPDAPLFLYLAPDAPHSVGEGIPPIPAPQDEHADVAPLIDLGAGFNERDVRDKPAWVRGLALTDPRFERRWLRQAARSLLDVDRAFLRILAAQQERDPGLHHTVILFMSDNGYSNGVHRWKTKGVPYEEAIRVPMRAYFPGVGPTTIHGLVTNLDVAPTIADAAGVAFRTNGDGASLMGGARPERDHFVIEGGVNSTNKTFCGIRARNKVYIKYATGESEFYNLRRDPFELHNRPSAPAAAVLWAMAVRECRPLPPTWPRASL